MANETSKNGSTKAFGGVLAIVALVTGIAAIVRPMQQQVDSVNTRMERIEARTVVRFDQLERKLQAEIGVQEKSVNELAKEIARLRDLVDSHKGDPLVHQAMQAILQEKIANLERRVSTMEGKK